MKQDELIDYAASLDCIHCGLCLRTCPTYRLTGVESSSPRGRIYMMRGVAEGRADASAPEFAEEMDFCLVCRHCESVCPAGVRFGEMMETTRAGLEASVRRPWHQRLARHLGFERLLPSRRALSFVALLLRFGQRTGLVRIVARLVGERGRGLASFPLVPPRTERQLLPPETPPRGATRGTCAMLEGCAMPELFGRVNRATASALAAIGWGSRRPSGHACCGALHAHNGELEGARRLARGTIEAFEALGPELPIVVNSAGCGAHMQEYGRLLADDPEWAARATAFAGRVEDFTQLMAREAPADFAPSAPSELRDCGPVAFDDPCHLCHGQGVRTPPRELLDRVTGLQRVELPDSESCCGSAGIYSMLRPADSAAIFAAKLEAFDRSGAQVLVTANPGCHLQWQAGFEQAGRDVRVLHIAELLAD